MAAVEAPHLASHPDAFLYNPTGNATSTPGGKKFLFQSVEGLSLQEYLRAGKALPGTVAAYEKLYPRTDVEKYLKTLDPKLDLYQAAQDNVLSIFNHTTEFDDGTFNQMFTLTTLIKNYAEEARNKTASLKAQLEIITKPGSRVTDPVVNKAIGTSRVIVINLEEKAKKMTNECSDMFKALRKFYDATEVDEKQVKSLNTKFNDLVPETSAKLAKLSETINKLRDEVAAAQKEHKEYAIKAGTAPLYGFIPGIGAVALPLTIVYTMRAVEMKEKWDKGLEELTNNETEQKTLIRILHSIVQLDAMTKDVRATINAALSACGKMRDAFILMQGDFSKILEKLNDCRNNTDKADIDFRDMSKEDLSDAEKKWQEVMDKTTLFVTVGKIEVK